MKTKILAALLAANLIHAKAADEVAGVTRPHRATNLWVSDANQALPQWLELNWQTPQKISEVRCY